MRQIKRRSALPVYIAAGAYALYALVMPLYKLWHFLAAALVTAGVWMLFDRLIKPEIVSVPEPEAAPEPPSPAQAVLDEAARARGEMERLAASIGEGAVGAKIAALADLSDAIARDGAQDSADLPQIQRFQQYFLPDTIRLLEAYDRLAAGGEGETVSAARERIVQMLDTEAAAFQKQLDALYQNDALDLDADIRVMEAMLAREGLSGDGLDELLRRQEGPRSERAQ